MPTVAEQASLIHRYIVWRNADNEHMDRDDPAADGQWPGQYL